MNEIICIRQGDNIQKGFDGFIVDCTNETWFVLISNLQSCCEQSGYLSSDDTFREYISAQLLDVVVVDESLQTMGSLPNLYEGGAVFVNFITNKGTFQLTVYNSHNGYYGHYVKIIRSKKEIFYEENI